MSETNTSATTGAQALAQMLDGYGVTHIFHVPAVLRSTMAELEKSQPVRSLASMPTVRSRPSTWLTATPGRPAGRACARLRSLVR